MKACELCKSNHNGEYGSGRFCSSLCARSFSTRDKRKDINRIVSNRLRRHKIEKNDNEIIEMVSKATSIAHLIRLLGLEKTSSAYSFLKQKIIDLELNILHFKKFKTVDEMLCFRPNQPKGDLKYWLRKIRKYECEICKLGPMWNEQKLTLQVDHIDGNRWNHFPENLRFLCPNCHSQTPTFSWRNTKRANSRKITVSN